MGIYKIKFYLIIIIIVNGIILNGSLLLWLVFVLLLEYL